jgi:hypothetical protein
MSVARSELEIRLLHALKPIACYDDPDRLRKRAEREYGRTILLNPRGGDTIRIFGALADPVR